MKSKNNRRIIVAVSLALGMAMTIPVVGNWQQRDQRQNRAPAQQREGIPAGIVWYGKLSDGLEVARATQKPILLVSAAPQCAGIPGMW
ncbi:MAG: hypothetical protein AAF456_14815 [Planctomycetota bacterium]